LILLDLRESLNNPQQENTQLKILTELTITINSNLHQRQLHPKILEPHKDSLMKLNEDEKSIMNLSKGMDNQEKHI